MKSRILVSAGTEEADGSVDIGVVMIGCVMACIGIMIFIDVLFLLKQCSPGVIIQEIKNFFSIPRRDGVM